MKNERTFSDILEYSREVFKNSFKDIIAVNSPLFLLLALLYYNFHKKNDWSLLTDKLQNWPTIALIILAAIVIYILALFYTWNIIVIKNNIFLKKVDLFLAFKKALSKAISVSILTSIYIVFIIFIARLQNISLFIKIGIFSILFLLSLPSPVFVIGLILQEGKFKDVFINSARICFTNCFKIVSYLTRGMFKIFFPNLCFLVVLYLSLAEEETNKDIEI